MLYGGQIRAPTERMQVASEKAADGEGSRVLDQAVGTGHGAELDRF